MKLFTLLFGLWVFSLFWVVFPWSYDAFTPGKDLVYVLGLMLLFAYALFLSLRVPCILPIPDRRLLVLVGIGMVLCFLPLAPFSSLERANISKSLFLTLFLGASYLGFLLADSHTTFFLRVLLGVAVSQALLVLVQFFSFDPFLKGDVGYWRVYGSLGNPTGVANVFLWGVPLALHPDLLPKKAQLGVVCFLALGLILSGSRMLAFLLLLWGFSGLIQRRLGSEKDSSLRKCPTEKAILLVLILSLLATFFIASGMGKQLSSLQGRVYFWQTTWSMIKKRPWTGWSAGHFEAHYPAFARVGAPIALPDHAHQDWLEWMAEYGVIPILALLILFLFTLLRGYKVSPTIAHTLSLLFASSLWNPVLVYTPTGFAFFSLFGLLLYETRPKVSERKGALLLTQIGLVLFLVFGCGTLPLVYNRLLGHREAGLACKAFFVGDYGTSIEKMERAVFLAPSEGAFSYELAQLLEGGKKWREALRYSQRATLTYADFDLYRLQVRVLWSLGRREEARTIVLWLSETFKGLPLPLLDP